MRFLLSILCLPLLAPAASVPWLPYDAERCVPYQTNPSICRTAWDWFVENNGEVSCYYAS